MLFDREKTIEALERAFPFVFWKNVDIKEKTWDYTTNRWLIHAAFTGNNADPEGFYCFQLTDDGRIGKARFYNLWDRGLANDFLKGA